MCSRDIRPLGRIPSSVEEYNGDKSIIFTSNPIIQNVIPRGLFTKRVVHLVPFVSPRKSKVDPIVSNYQSTRVYRRKLKVRMIQKKKKNTEGERETEDVKVKKNTDKNTFRKTRNGNRRKF